MTRYLKRSKRDDSPIVKMEPMDFTIALDREMALTSNDPNANQLRDTTGTSGPIKFTKVLRPSTVRSHSISFWRHPIRAIRATMWNYKMARYLKKRLKRELY